jgi:CHAT domain-containing protein/Tfp pilus assembly protein PilF
MAAVPGARYLIALGGVCVLTSCSLAHPYLDTSEQREASLMRALLDRPTPESLELRRIMETQQRVPAGMTAAHEVIRARSYEWLLEQHEFFIDPGDSLYHRLLPIEVGYPNRQAAEVGLDPAVTMLVFDELIEISRAGGDSVREEPVYRRILAERERLSGVDSPSLLMTLGDLAKVLMKNGDYERAGPLYERALRIAETAHGPEHAETAVAFDQLAEYHRVRGDLDRAKRLYERSLSIREKTIGSADPDFAASLNNVGVIYAALGDRIGARGLFERAAGIFEKEESQSVFPHTSAIAQENAAIALSNAGVVAWKEGQSREALAHLKRAYYLHDYHLWSRFDRLIERQQLAFLDAIAEETDALLAFDHSAGRDHPEAARVALTILLRRKGRVLEALTHAMSKAVQPEDRAHVERMREVRARISNLNITAPPEMTRDERATEIAKLEREERWLQRRFASYTGDRGGSTIVEEVQRALPPDAVLVEFAVYRPMELQSTKAETRWGPRRYAAYVLRREGEPSSIDLGDATAIERSVAELRRGLSLPTGATGMVAARALDDLIMRPIRKYLGDTRHILLSPEGALHLVPFGALRDEGARFLIERYTFTYLTTGRDLLRTPSPTKPSQSTVIVADPDFFGTRTGVVAAAQTSVPAPRSVDFASLELEPLPATGEEARAISAIVPNASILSGAAATESALKQVRSPRILHVATHGFFLPDQRPSTEQTKQKRDARARPLENPLLRSGLLLAGANRLASGADDGILTALEAASLELGGTQLVVLSACETGLGDVANGEGVYGLRRALAIAGAETQVLSLWKVDDDSTRELMVEFYRQLMVGAGRSEALRAAQLKMFAAKDTTHPFFWAAFIPSGEWKSLGAR